MNLSDEEHAMLNGEYGPGVQKAMEIITALGKIYGADDLVSVASVQVAGVSYKNLGDAGLDFLADWTAQGARVRVPTTLNPAGLDLESWRDIGFDAEFAEKQQRVIDAFAGMGIRTTCTCTPYLIGNTPQQGQHIAWAESSAVSFANSVLGARTNREGGPSALAAAIIGRTARYGLHLAQNRRAHMTVEVRCAVESFSDFGALGTIVGKRARNRIPYFTNLPLPRGLTLPDPRAYDLLKTLGASMAASGAVALYHIEGVTPEASPNVVMPNAEHMVVEDLSEGYQMLNSDDGRTIDLVWMGCPHASREELAHIVELLRGRRIQVPLWVTMARSVRDEAKQAGLVDQLEAAGGKIIADTCLVVAPVNTLGFHRIATPSGKGAYYVPTHSGISVRYGSVEACVEAAITGEWEA